jgi:hypothetical protein
MEPVFFALGQAAGTTAVLALKADCDVQDVNYGELRRRLISDGQVLGISSGSEGQLPTKGIKR